MKYFWTRYIPSYHTALVYMLQVTEYSPHAYTAWLHRVNDFRSVMHRQQLDKTAKARLLLLSLRLASGAVVIAVAWLCILAMQQMSIYTALGAVILFAAYPFLLAYGSIGVLQVGYVLVQRPQERAIIRRAKELLEQHTAKERIAIVGSYGKTTAKEILRTVLGESLDVAATPGNMNTDIGISRFVSKLRGDETVLIFEYGEERVGDVARLAEFTKPTMALLTGASAAHMDTFGSIENVIKTLREIEQTVSKENIYVNADSPLLADVGMPSQQFKATGIHGWRVEDVKADIKGTAFTLRKDKQSIHIATELIGEHLIAVCSAVAVLALRLGMKPSAIETGFKKVRPFEHRMQPYMLHGAYIIDDTYNGNSEGMKAGLALLKDAKTKGRKIYVTPGLVEQGDMTQSVHETIGEQIASSADVVVLMNNSATKHILHGMEKAGFSGELVQIDDPLEFYKNLDQFVLDGDVVLMQNDWTDNYA